MSRTRSSLLGEKEILAFCTEQKNVEYELNNLDVIKEGNCLFFFILIYSKKKLTTNL